VSRDDDQKTTRELKFAQVNYHKNIFDKPTFFSFKTKYVLFTRDILAHNIAIKRFEIFR